MGKSDLIQTDNRFDEMQTGPCFRLMQNGKKCWETKSGGRGLVNIHGGGGEKVN